MRRLFGCPDIVSLTEKFLMARNFFRIFTENNPVMGYSKTFFIPEAKGLTTMPVCWECVWHMCAMWYHLSNGRKSGWRTRASAFLISGVFFCYETMSNCSQNCWIDWNSAVLCFKWLSHKGMNVYAICEASLSHHTVLYMGTLVPACTMYQVFPCWQQKKVEKTVHHHTDFEA